MSLNLSTINLNTIQRVCLHACIVMCIFFATIPVVRAQQQYPVQIQPSVLYPTAFVSDFANPANTSIRIYLADLTKVNYTINVRINLTALGGTVAYKSINGINITLDGGQVYFLNANELYQLFALTNLTRTATVLNQFDNSLPEGAYALSVEAFDVTLLPTLVPVSNVRTDFTLFNVVRYDPPMLTTPANATQFDLQTSNQNIFFNWTPRQVALSPQQQIKYRFRLIKVIPVDRNPYDAMNTTLAGATGNIDVSALDFATFIYSPTDLQLEAGHVYAWQVQAYEVINGQESTSRFKNQGYSEVFTISIKETCDQITLVQPVITATNVTFTWNGVQGSTYSEYEFNYKPSGSSAPWIPISTTQNTLTLNNTLIQAGIDYDYTVRARCTNWLAPVQGGTFKLIAPTCVAPAPVLVNTNNGQSTNLSWTAALAADSLKLYYKITSSTSPFTEVLLNGNATQYALPLLTQGGYTIKLNSICGNDIGAGIENTFDYNENGIVGPCTVPIPFNLIATRVKGDTAKLVWNNNSTIHTAYSITYWHKDSSAVTRTINPLLIPQTNAIRVYDDQIYAYQIDYVCGTKHTLTPVGMFKISSAAAQLILDPPTANCFPPVDIRAEARDTITARVEWDKVTGAEEYELSYRIKNSGAPFVRFNTTATSATLKPLAAAEKYQLLVRVKCSGLYSIYSDTALVDLAQARNRTCDTATYFKALQKTVSNIQVAWNLDSTCTGYVIKYREASQPLASQYTQAFTNIDTLQNKYLTAPDTVKFTFQNLKSGTSYVFRIQKICGQQNAIFNAPLVVSTLPDTKSSGACGSENVCNKVPRDPLRALAEGDTIYCADYVILVDSVTTTKSNASQGLYTGLGHMAMPMPGVSDFVNMHVSFDSVKINGKPNSCMYEGIINIDSMNASFIPTDIRVSISEFMDQVSATIDSAQAILNQVQAGLTAAQAGLQQGIDYFQGGDGVGNVVTGELGETPVAANIPVGTTSATVNATANGYTISIAGTSVAVASLPVLLKDNDNPAKVFQVTSTGQVTYVGAYNTAFAKDTTLDLTAQIVTYTEFTGSPSATYDFDAREDAYSRSIQIDREYEKIGTSYYVPAKFITPGALDKVTATLSGTGADATKVVFSNGKGFVYPSSPIGNTLTFTLNLAGGPGSDGQYIYAWYVNGTTKKAIGKLLLPSYTPKTKNVVLIPVKGAQTFNPATYEAYLNETYQKIGITYHVTLDNSFRTNKDWTTGSDTIVQSSASGLLSNDYQGKEAAIIQAYVAFKGAANIDANTAYFMAVYEPSLVKDGTNNLLGKMPAQEQFGYIYSGGFGATGSLQDDRLIRTMAHELGHGAYHMEHTFNSIYLGSTTKGTTNNLMDYASDNHLWKFQWDAVHAPGHVWGILKRDREANMVIVQDLNLLSPYLNNSNSYTFISPAGKQISLPADVETIVFYSNDETSDYSRTKLFVYPDGAIRGFVLKNGKRYYASYSVSDGTQFQGYFNDADEVYTDVLTKNLSPSDKLKAIVGNVCLQNGVLKFIVNRVKYEGVLISGNNTGSGTYVSQLPVSQISPPVSPANIYLTFTTTTPYSQLALEFLSKNSTCDNVFPKYVLTIANLIDANQELIRDCWGMLAFVNEFAINPACTTCVNKPLQLTEADYKSKVDNLISTLETFSSIKTLLENTNASAETLRNAFRLLPNCVYGQFSAIERVNAIKILAKEDLYNCKGLIYNQIDALNNCAEEYVKNLVLKTPPEQVVAFLTALDNETLSLMFNCNNGSIGLSIAGLSSENASEVAYTLVHWMDVNNFNKGTPDQQYDKAFSFSMYDYKGPGFLSFGSTYDVYMPNSDWVSGKIKFTISTVKGELPTLQDVTYPVSWDDWIIVRALEDLSYNNELVIQKGKIGYFPAFYLFYAIQNAKTSYVAATIRVGFDVITIAAGGGAIINGAVKLSKVVAVADIALSSTDLLIANNETEVAAWLGSDFLEAWNFVISLYGIGTTVRAISPALYSKSLLIHNELQNIDWNNVPANIKATTIAALKKYKLKLEAIYGARFINPVFLADAFIPIKSASANTKLFKTVALDAATKQLVFDVVENGAYKGGSLGFFDKADNVLYSPQPNPVIPVTGTNGVIAANVATLELNGVSLTKTVSSKNSATITKIGEYGYIDDIANPAAIQLNAAGTLPKVSVYKVSSQTLGEAIFVEASLQSSTQITPRLLYASQTFTRALIDENNQNQCTYCRSQNKPLCYALNRLYTSTADDIGVKKLCNSTINDITLKAIVDRLNADVITDITMVKAFLNDIKGAGCTANFLCANVNTLTIDLLEAWKIIYSAKPNLSYRRDFNLIKQIALMRSPAKTTMYQNLGGDAVLKDIITKNVGAQCNGCTNGITWVQYMDEYLKDVVYFVETYNNTAGKSSVFSAGITSGSLKQRYGAMYMLKVLRAYPGIIPTKFEDNISASGSLNGCHPDARIGEEILEFKSWSPNDSDTDIGSMGDDEENISLGRSYFKKFSENDFTIGSSSSYTQFLCYLNTIQSMDELSYYFDKTLIEKRGQTNAEAYVKNIFKALYTNNKYDDQAGKQGIFDVLWDNQALRTILFAGLSEDLAKDKYDTFVLDPNSLLYSIINVR